VAQVIDRLIIKKHALRTTEQRCDMVKVGASGDATISSSVTAESRSNTALRCAPKSHGRAASQRLPEVARELRI